MSHAWWDVLLPELRHVIYFEWLDFISLVATALSCKRAMRDTQLARGIRMAHPEHPERLPRLPEDEHTPCWPYGIYRRGIQHAGYAREAMKKRGMCAYAHIEAEFVSISVIHAIKEKDEACVLWLLASFCHIDLDSDGSYCWSAFIADRLWCGDAEQLHLFHRLLPRKRFKRSLIEKGKDELDIFPVLRAWALQHLCD
jgi:hypothetical protein